MGLFNFFIVLPQLVVSGAAGYLVRHAFADDPAGIMLVGGGALVIAAALSWRRVAT
jgi:maltose/moltooligosaccharide transporter